MAKLTRNQERELETILYHLKRGHDMVHRKDTIICIPSRGHTTIEYHRPSDNTYITAINKEIGSDLAGFDFAISYLQKFLDNHRKV